MFFLIGSDPGEQQNLHHPRQGPQPPDQAAAPLPVQEHAEGHARQHAQEPAGAAHPRERDLQDQKELLPGPVPCHRHGYGNRITSFIGPKMQIFIFYSLQLEGGCGILFNSRGHISGGMPAHGSSSTGVIQHIYPKGKQCELDVSTASAEFSSTFMKTRSSIVVEC